MKKKIALITGITGQDGSYLLEFLLKKNYVVYGIKRKSSSLNTQRIDHVYENLKYKKNFFLIYGDLTDANNISYIINKIQPNEIYNLAAQSHVNTSFELPEYTSQVNALGPLKILETIRLLGLKKKVRFYQASTSELYGDTNSKKQSENTVFNPQSPYAISKLFAYWITKNYRDSFGIYAVNGILFNHESPRRGETFVTRKITIGLSKIAFGFEKILYLGNIHARRDWGHAKDYAEMQWLMLQQTKPDDYVVSTDKDYSVKFFLEQCCRFLKIKIKWKGKKNRESAYVVSFDRNICPALKTGMKIIQVDKKYFRPQEVNYLRGNSAKSRSKLKWKPKINFYQLVNEMISHDYNFYKNSFNKLTSTTDK
jgi:GDPmannose 4,6-dehydratase